MTTKPPSVAKLGKLSKAVSIAPVTPNFSRNSLRRPPPVAKVVRLSWLLIGLVLPAHADTFEFANGSLRLTFDDATGALVRIVHGDRELACSGPDVTPVTFSTGSADKPDWFEHLGWPRKLVRRSQPAPDVMEVIISAGPLELVERYRLHGDQPRLDRSLSIVNRGQETITLRQLAFRTVGIHAKGAGFYRFPAIWPPGGHAFAEMQPGTKHRGGRNTLAPLLAELSSRESLLWASYTEDAPSVEVWEGSGQFEVRQWLNAAARLLPNQPQDYGFVSLELAAGDYWAALPRLWEWMDSVGAKVPADRPDWVRDAILYSFHPGGTIGSQFKDLGGFDAARERLLPTLPRLGVNAIWIMPVEHKSPYWPLDYYRFMDGLGNGDQYRALVAEAHRLGLRVWQDLVPHGGAPQAVHNVAHPEFMLRREDGSHLDYWLNDFAWPDWQKFIAGVAGHYVKEYGVDGYRVDACFGSKEINWNPAIPYRRASLSLMHGGLGMLHGIRGAVRAENPRNGSILAEVESARHEAEADAVYDFGFCYNVCRQWLRMDGPAFVAALQDYLEEQKLAEPRGAVRLRHIESHDALRSQGWYGVRGMRAMYALSAWIDGLPLMYHGMETGQAFELARINQLRRERPELARGEALYRAVKCDAPGVFTCLRKLGERASVVAINFNRDPVTATLVWPGGQAAVNLKPLDYTLLPDTVGASVAARDNPTADRSPVPVPDSLPFTGATEWFVDTLEGRLHDAFTGPLTSGPGKTGSIYWRPQGTGVLWSQETLPLDPVRPRLGFKTVDGTWHVSEWKGSPPDALRLAERVGDTPGLHLLGGTASQARVSELKELPVARDVTADAELGGVRLRCVGPDYVLSNRHFTARIGRQGGVLRQLRNAKGEPLAERQDLYGDQEYFALKDAKRIDASNDVESGVRVWVEAGALHLRFEGQLRGDYRFSLKRPPLWFRTEYVFTEGPRFRQTWSFRTEKDFRDAKAFLTWIVGNAAGDHFRFERNGELITEGSIGAEPGRVGQTAGKPRPDVLLVSRDGKPLWSLRGLSLPAEASANGFFLGRMLFLTLLDGHAARMEAGRWYDCAAEWEVAGR